ncbi:penicillin-binding protein [Brevibacillus choshinensis]|uniref:Penicillin-binding protein n=1 Tax=Brevibacillus choshinensis TaxID=54911 RepID=A0ABR5N0I8_BRECH|nr:serine hydrolase domain-containing protein [Brevibacillus choshinensis]KQL43971.1 penicillin-binding protein [Brevibacillus choshinensis]
MAQPGNSNVSSQLEEFFATLANKQKFNGNILVLEQGEAIFTGSYGFADLERSLPLTHDTVFELASVSKAFTAMGIMLLQEQGKIEYEDKVDSILPDFPYRDITVRNLLSHTSGLPDYMDLFAQYWDRTKIATNADVLEQLGVHQPAVLFQPNEKFEYSNTGYVLLGSIIEKVSGMSFSEFLKMYIFTPLEMENTRVFNRRFSQEVIENYAYGYVYSDELGRHSLPDHVKEYDLVIYLDGIQGDGVVNSTLEDLRKWDRALYTEKLVSSKTIQAAFTPVTLADNSTYHYGYGWLIRNDPWTGKVVYHGGGWPGYKNWLGRYIDVDKTIIYLTNVEQDREFTLAVLEAAENILFRRPYRIPE